VTNETVVKTPVYLTNVNTGETDFYILLCLRKAHEDKMHEIAIIYCQEQDEYVFIKRDYDELLKHLNENGFILEKVPEDQYRVCDSCKKFMQEGFVFESDCTYYCSEECRRTVISDAEYEAMYDDGNGDAYWTEWYTC